LRPVLFWGQAASSIAGAAGASDLTGIAGASTKCTTLKTMGKRIRQDKGRKENLANGTDLPLYDAML